MKTRTLIVLVLLWTATLLWSSDEKLLRAAASGNLNQLTELLSSGSNPNTLDEHSPLLAACKQGHDEVIIALIIAGSDVEAADKNGNTPMHLASCTVAVPETLRRLYQAGGRLDLRNEGGDTPLLSALKAGRGDLATALIGLGAAIPLSNEEQELAKSLSQNLNSAEERSQFESMWRSCLYQSVNADNASSVQAITPGTDLRALTETCPDGSVLQLPPGETPGIVHVTNDRRITIIGADDGSSVLTGGDHESAVVVDSGGKLAIKNLTLRPAGTANHGVFCNGGEIYLRGVEVDTPRGTGVYAESAVAHISESKFVSSENTAVVALNNTPLTLRGTDLSNAGLCVAAESSGDVSIVDCQFDQVDQSVSFNASGKSIYLVRNLFNPKSPPGDTNTTQVYLTSPQEAVCVRNHVFGPGHGITTMLSEGSSLSITRNTILSNAQPLTIKAGGSDNAPTVRVSDNLLLNPGGVGSWFEGSRRFLLSNNVIVSGEHQAMTLSAGAYARITDSIIAAPSLSINFQNSEPGLTSVSRVATTGLIDPPGSVLDSDLELWQNAALDASWEDFNAESVAKIKTEILPLINGVRNEESLQKLSQVVSTLKKDIDHLSNITGQQGVFEFRVKDRLGNTGTVGYDLYRVFDSDHVAEARRKLGSAGNQQPDAFSEIDPNEIYQGVFPDEPDVALPIGTYLIEPWHTHIPTQTADILPGEKTRLVTEFPNGQWLHLYRYRENEEESDNKIIRESVLSAMKSTARLRSDLAQFNHIEQVLPPAMPRPSLLNGEELEEELELARRALKAMEIVEWVAPEGVSEEEHRPRWNAYKVTRNAALRLLAIGGNEKDIPLILETGHRLDIDWHTIATVGWMEARLGTIENGELVKLLESEDQNIGRNAAQTLHQYGINSGKHWLKEKHQYTGYPAYLDFYDKNHLDAIRGDLRETLAKQKAEPDTIGGSGAEVLYLLAWGDKEDWELVSRLRLSTGDIGTLGLAVADLEPLFEVAGRSGNSMLYLSDLTPSAPGSFRDLRNAVWRTANDPDQALFEFDAGGAWLVPSRRVIESHYKGNNIWAEYSPWSPVEPAQLTKDMGFYHHFLSGTIRSGLNHVFDHVPPEQFASDLEDRNARDVFPELDVILASHRHTNRSHLPKNSNWVEPFQRRGFLLRRYEEEMGAIGGIVKARPIFVGPVLQVNLSIEQSSFLPMDTGLALMISQQKIYDTPGYPYTVCGGRELIQSVTLIRAGKRYEGLF